MLFFLSMIGFLDSNIYGQVLLDNIIIIFIALGSLVSYWIRLLHTQSLKVKSLWKGVWFVCGYFVAEWYVGVLSFLDLWYGMAWHGMAASFPKKKNKNK